MSNVSLVDVELNPRPEVIGKLERLGLLQTDSANGHKYYEAMYDGVAIRFYLGVKRQLPKDWAEGLRASNAMPMDEKCKQCKGTGQLITGVCHVCNGTVMILTNKQFNLFRVSNEIDPLSLDLTGLTLTPVEAELSKSAK